MADVFKALADPTRRMILDELVQRDGQSLFEICSRLAMRHGNTSARQACGAAARGVRFVQAPTVMGPVVTAVLDDTCGNLIQLTSPRSRRTASRCEDGLNEHAGSTFG